MKKEQKCSLSDEKLEKVTGGERIDDGDVIRYQKAAEAEGNHGKNGKSTLVLWDETTADDTNAASTMIGTGGQRQR